MERDQQQKWKDAMDLVRLSNPWSTHLGIHFMLQVRQSGGGGGGIETANIMLAQLNAQKSVKSKYISSIEISKQPACGHLHDSHPH